MALAAGLSCFLGACIAAGPDEEGVDEAVDLATEEEGLQAAAADTAEVGGEEADAVGCIANGNWCLARCSKTGDMQHVVGKKANIVGTCSTAGEKYCQAKGLGYRTHVCWGYVNNQ